MKRAKKHIALAVAAAIIYTIFAGLTVSVYAAAIPVNISVVSYRDGELAIKWTQPPGTQAAMITYHEPGTGDIAIEADAITVAGKTTATITGLKADYIYDIRVTLYGAADIDGNPVGDPVGQGLLFFLPSITFTARTPAPSPSYEDLPGGGRESGKRPILEFKWAMPKSYFDEDYLDHTGSGTYNDPDTGNNVFAEASDPDVREFMEKALNDIYIDSTRDLSTLNFRINISNRMNQLNSGSMSAVLIDQSADGSYKAYISGKQGTTVDVARDAQGFYTLRTEGRADANSEISSDKGPGVLANEEIFPGTVYYMNIKPIYKDNAGEVAMLSAVTVGDPADMNGSVLSGERSYINTPIRFQLTKDSANNIYVKIFKVNQGSLDLPQLYYEVQVTDDPSLPEWKAVSMERDSNPNIAYVLTVIPEVKSTGVYYYKIVAKSDNANDKLESLILPYDLTIDSSRPPLPMGVVVTNRELNTKNVDKPTPDDITDPELDDITVKSTNITISWEKPSNWDDVKDKLYFHFLISTNQFDLADKERIYVHGKPVKDEDGSINQSSEYERILWGDNDGYAVKYRMVKVVGADPRYIRETADTNGKRLEYTLDAFDLFTWNDVDGGGEGISGEIARPLGDETYPGFLLPNTVYYLQMYTTIEDNVEDALNAGPDSMSDKSVITSFTTLNGIEPEVPLPGSFQLVETATTDDAEGNELNYIKLRFDKVFNLDWRNYVSDYNDQDYDYDIYYDIFMSPSANSRYFIPIGTTQAMGSGADVIFSGADDPDSTFITATISQFTQEYAQMLMDCGLLANGSTTTPRTVFGSKLLPNTTYYFIVRTRLVISDGKTDDKTSVNSALLPVTTKQLEIPLPDVNLRKPLAPTDFRVAQDSNGNLLISGSSVTFTWTSEKDSDNQFADNVIYQLIRTSRRVDPSDSLDGYRNDPEYTSFLKEYGRPPEEPLDSRVIYLDPMALNDYDGKFRYKEGTCTFVADKALFPNKLYFFSLKAIRVDPDTREPLEPVLDSAWVSIPVTTHLIEKPYSLEAILVPELGFRWEDDTVGLTADDFRIYVKTSAESVYKQMSRAQSTIIKDNDARTYYARVTGLKPGTSYDVKVIKGKDTTAFMKSGLMTRDSYHELEVKWIGMPQDSYGRYELAIMEEGASEYTVLTDADLEMYIDKNNNRRPYYIDETSKTLGKENELYYYARIKTMDVTLPGGIRIKQPLKSNTRYFIKVRAVQRDPVELDMRSESKYDGPVNMRTEFNQADYDDKDREEQRRAVFLDRMKELEKGYYWRVAMDTSNITKILLKGDRVADALKNTAGDSFVVDLSGISLNINKDEIYMPINVIDTMRTMKKSLVIRTGGTELMLRYGSLDASFNELVKDISARNDVRDIYVRLELERESSVPSSLPAGQVPVSAVNDIELQAQGFSVAYKDMSAMFHNKLYNEDTGLAGKMLGMLLNAYIGDGAGSSELTDTYMLKLLEMIEIELSDYIDDILRSSKLANAVKDIQTFDAPATANLAVSSAKGVRVPYALYDGSSSWQKISSGTSASGSTVRFNIIGTGKVVVLSPKSLTGDVSGHWAENSVNTLVSRYDLEDVFPGIQTSFMPDKKITCREIVLLYEKVTGKSEQNTGLDARARLYLLKLDDIVPANTLARNADRQQTAAVLYRLFSVKQGVDASGLRPAGRSAISDESSIMDEYYTSVILIVDMEVMRLDAGGKFNPGSQVSRAEAVEAFVRLLRLTGDL